MGQTTSKVRLDGFCDENYLPVKEHLENMLKNGAEENLQLCIYVEGKCVVDLYGTAVDDRTYTADSLQVNINGLSAHSHKVSIKLGALFCNDYVQCTKPIMKRQSFSGWSMVEQMDGVLHMWSSRSI